jgi:hypothetical protein
MLVIPIFFPSNPVIPSSMKEYTTIRGADSPVPLPPEQNALAPRVPPMTAVSGHTEKRFLALSLHKDRGLDFDLDVDSSGEIQLHQRVNGLVGRVEDVDQALVSARFELLSRLLVNVR